MKFSEKLVNLRKQNKMSQEQLASMLDVSRQAVSKWESGTTYPEMDKLITMCKIFKCSLDDLTNDEVAEINFEEKKKNNFLFEALDMVVKTLDMLKAMTFKQIVSCIFSMGFLALVLLILKLPVDYIISLGNRVIIHLNFLPNIFSNIWAFLVTIAYVAIYFVTLVYVFKSRYLDQFEYTSRVTITNKENKDTLKPNKLIESIAINNNQNNSFFRVFGLIVMILIKSIIVFLLVPLIVTFVCLFAALIITIILLFKKVIYIGVILGIIFGILLNYVILELGYDFLFNKKTSVQRIFIMLIISIAGIGIAIGIFAYEISITQYINESPVSYKAELVKEYDMNDKLYIYDLSYYNNEFIEYETDENLKDKIKVKVIYNDSYHNIDIRKYDDGIGIYFLDNDNIINNKELLELVIKDLSKKKIHNYNYLDDYKIVIISSSKNIEKIKINNENKLLEEKKQNEQEINNEYQQQINQYEQEILELNEQIEVLNNKINTLEDTNSNLKIDIENYKDKIKEYKENLNNLLEE